MSAPDRKEQLEEQLRVASELYLSKKFSATQLKEMSQCKASGGFLLLFESEESLLETITSLSIGDCALGTEKIGPAKFQFLPSEGIAFLYDQMELPSPPIISFDVEKEAVVVSVVCLSGSEEGEGLIYQNVFVFAY